MDPDFLTKFERDPVGAIHDLLDLTDRSASERVRSSCRSLINNKPSSRLAARRSALNLGRHPSLRRKEIADETGVGSSAISQTVHRIQAEITRRSLDVRDHELIKYIADQVGTVALVAALPEWVRLIVTVEPSPLDDDWGTPNDFAQFVTAVALGDSGFVTHAAEGGESEEAHWWITPGRAEIGPTMATLALEITAGRSRVWSPSDLEHELGRCGVVRNHQSPVIDAMKAGRRLLWIPSTQRYVVFAHDPSRSSRGSAPDRATDAMRLLADRDPDALEAELIAEFVAQHGLKPDSAAAAVRSARSELR